MQEPASDQSRIKEIQSALASLDVDIKLLRLGMKAGFNPSQPRVPAGDPDGGQWTDTGAGGSDNPRQSTFRTADRARIVTRFGAGHSIADPRSRHTVTLANGKRFVFETEGAVQSVFDGKGRPISKAIWTPAGPESLPIVQQAGLPAREAVDAFEAARHLYNRLTAGNSPEQRACLAFTATEFEPDSTLPTVNFVGMLSRADTAAVCSRLDTVQRLADEASVEARAAGTYPNPAVYGTAVHTRLSHKIRDLGDPSLRPERSLTKKIEEAPFSNAVRVDVLEDHGTGPICVYDLKTGRRGLSKARTLEFGVRLAKYGRPIIVIEIRPFE
ncbi:hypothetical protein SAMN04488498_103165 [Mesorhizobium albiziae]|uniref:PD-(D/E)XK nuclease superfamily protein n=1 Tax=Neomesorhizobium albiziae TaxID=335020 RepID=A0A1I3XFF1_9HYPH|nr:hypothetical protein [Mesorhizobium albiziae]GLS30522.1 hypothetical protein GCM10007937_22300 [Mesorhizobium albiziae]SFK17796.1 hypothetical protein SAMN04488498_103165 [Mesorhizobium albiziae]